MISHYQRWIELRIGEWLGPAKEGFKGNQYSGSSPDDEAEIHNRHKHEFRFLAANKAIFTAILENYPAQEITRAALLLPGLGMGSQAGRLIGGVTSGGIRVIEVFRPLFLGEGILGKA